MKGRIKQITDEKFQELFRQQTEEKKQVRHDSFQAKVGNLHLSILAQDINPFQKSYFSQNHPKTKEAQAKLKQIQEEQQRFKQKIEGIKRRDSERKRQKEILDEEIKRSLEKEKKEKYKQLVLKSIQQKSAKKEERKKREEKFQQFLKSYKNVKPLHVQMEQEYKQKFQLPMIEQNKKKLQQIKHRVKPTLQQINEHETNYLQQKQGRQSRVFIANKTIDVSFKSKFYEQESKRYANKQEGYETLFDQAEKKKRYSELVKQNFKPKVSKKLQQSIAQSHMRSSSVRQALDRSSLVERGNQYLDFMRSLQKNRKQHSSPSERDQQQKQKHANRYINYLESLKQSRQFQGNQSRISNDWQRDAKNKTISDYERRERILMKSKQLQQKANRQQKIMSYGNYGRAAQVIQKKRQIDDTLISSIRAKVAVLRDAHQL